MNTSSPELRVLVTGSRYWTQPLPIQAALLQWADRAQQEGRELVVVHGGALGADTLADRIARVQGWTLVVFAANWKRGKRAGAERNARMLDWSVPEVVLAFPLQDSIGTWDMIRKAQARGIPVVVQGPS